MSMKAVLAFKNDSTAAPESVLQTATCRTFHEKTRFPLGAQLCLLAHAAASEFSQVFCGQ